MTRDEIRELAAFQADESKGACAMTFYFQPDPPQDRSNRTQAIVAKDVVKQALKSVADKGANGWLHADLDRVLEVAAGLRQMVWPLLDRGQIAPVIAATYPLTEAAEAHRLMESSAHIGKIVLTL